MEKFRMRLIDPWTKKQVKQKTFMAKDWDEAEEKAHKMWYEHDDIEAHGYTTDMSLSIIKEVRR